VHLRRVAAGVGAGGDSRFAPPPVGKGRKQEKRSTRERATVARTRLFRGILEGSNPGVCGFSRC